MAIRNDTAGVTALLARLIAQPSVNPNHQPPKGPNFGEAGLARLLTDLLAPTGAVIEVADAMPGRPNFIARIAGRDRSRCLMLEAHGDTVETAGMTVEPFGAEIIDGRMYGRGACDTKGPMAAMIQAILDVVAADGQPPTDLCFVSTCDEELGCTGAHKLMADGFAVDAAVVAEPTGMEIVHAHKGVVRWVIETQGVAGHSSNPAGGVNAISQMRKIIEVIDGPVAESLTAQTHPLLGHPTISVGTVTGGTQVNVIPAACRIEVDRRMLPGETPEAAIREITDRLDALAREDPTFKYTWRQHEYYPPLDQAIDAPITRLATDACQAVLGRASLATAPWAATAGVFDEAGIPSVLFGPGSIAQAHTKDEFIDLAELVQAVGVYAEIIRRFGDL